MYSICHNVENCPMRHENGNCLPMGGFCNTLKSELCDALHQAFEKGYYAGVAAVINRNKEDTYDSN